ncbi:MAG: RING finger protein [Candidatus Hodarchaeota archaeon]
MKEILEKINKDRISAELVHDIMQDKGWNFKKQEEYLISNLRIEFENPKFWFYLGMIFYENYELDKSREILLENALFCFNKPFEKNKNEGKTVFCESFDDPKDLFSLSYSEYIDFLNKSLDHLIVLYKTPCFFEGFLIPNITPKKPEIIERYEVIIRADYNELIEKREKIFDQQIQKIQKNQEKPSIFISNEGQCVICRKKIENKLLTCSNCTSKFHKKCFLNWIETNKSCPVCQKKLELFD